MGQLVGFGWTTILSHHLPHREWCVWHGFCLLSLLRLVPGVQILQWCGVRRGDVGGRRGGGRER